MKVLLLGGAGHVGSFITPYLQEAPRAAGPRSPTAPPRRRGVRRGLRLRSGRAATALTGVDAFIWVVMRKPQGGSVRDQDIPTIVENYEVNTKALHLTLFIAQELGVMRGIYTSSMSVHYRMRERFEQEELIPLDTPTVYGLSKGFGELICQYFARWWDMNLIALRITGPRTREQYLDERETPRIPRDRQAAVRDRRGGSRQRLPGRPGSGPDRAWPLRRHLHRRRRARAGPQPLQGEARPRLGAALAPPDRDSQ